MDSHLNKGTNNEYPLYFYIHLFFVFVGFIIYLTAIILFLLFYRRLSYIKREIFNYILLNSCKSFLEIVLSSSIKKELILYVFEIIEFYLIIAYINRSLTSEKISENYQGNELEYKYFILLGFIIISFPYEKFFNLTGKYIFSLYTINIVLAILLFRYINIKMQLLLDFLKEKKTNSEMPDIDLPYKKANYYYNNFSTINIIFDATLIFVIIYNLIKILDLFFEWKDISIYLKLFFEECIYSSLIAGCLIFFFSLNRDRLLSPDITKIGNGETINFSKYSVVDADIQQDETINYTKKKKKVKEREINKDKENDNYGEDTEKKKNNRKITEESENLK